MNLQVLAEKLSLSRATISRALRNDERISTKTRERVQAAAEAAGYRQNPYVSVLMSKLRHGVTPLASPVIAYINPQPSRDFWRGSKHWLYTFRGAVDRAEELGFEIQEFWLREPGMTPERLTDILAARNIRAVILAPPLPGQSVDFVPKNCAAVACDVEPAGDHLHRASTDYLGNTLKALRAMRELGYKRIGLAMDIERARYMHLLPRTALLEFEETIPAGDRTGYWLGSVDGMRDFARWMHSARPDGIVTANWIPQVWLQPLGFRIPQDIGIAQLEPMFFPYQYSGIDGRYEQVGRAAVDLLVTQIHANQFSLASHPNHVLNTGIWRPGFSTPPRRENAPLVYDEARLTVLSAAANGDAQLLFRTRRSLADRTWSPSFSLVSRARPESWRTISLLGAANARWECPSWPRFSAEPLGCCSSSTRPAAVPLPTLQGLHRLHGIPFDLQHASDQERLTAIALSENLSPNGPSTCRVPLDLRVHALYFFHLAFFAWDGRPPGEYRIHFENRVEKILLRPFFPSHEEISTATFQDSWPTHPQFESKNTKPVFLSEPGRMQRDRFGYVLEFENRDVDQRLTAIEFISYSQADTVILVGGITALLASPEAAPKPDSDEPFYAMRCSHRITASGSRTKSSRWVA